MDIKTVKPRRFKAKALEKNQKKFKILCQIEMFYKLVIQAYM